ncbi:MAG: nuclear transport factor 2 family protein [Acidimicrobiia bacterium]|nr:nuclear transport factor 2 family protein [Acidimicrobiia bacterium]
MLLVVAAGAVGWVLGSSDDTTDTPAIVERWQEAWLSGDPDAVAALYAEDATWQDPTEVGVIRGRGGIQSNAEFTFAWLTFSDFEDETVVVGEGVIVVESIWSGDSRSLTRAEMTPFSTKAVTILEVDDDLITGSAIYFDPDELFN